MRDNQGLDRVDDARRDNRGSHRQLYRHGLRLAGPIAAGNPGCLRAGLVDFRDRTTKLPRDFVRRYWRVGIDPCADDRRKDAAAMQRCDDL